MAHIALPETAKPLDDKELDLVVKRNTQGRIRIFQWGERVNVRNPRIWRIKHVRVLDNPLYRVYFKGEISQIEFLEISQWLTLNYNRRTIQGKIDIVAKVNSTNYKAYHNSLAVKVERLYPFFEWCKIYPRPTVKHYTEIPFSVTRKKIDFIQHKDGQFLSMAVKHKSRIQFTVIFKGSEEFVYNNLLIEKIFSLLQEVNRRQVQIDLDTKIEKLEKFLQLLKDHMTIGSDLMHFLDSACHALKEIFNVDIVFATLFSKRSKFPVQARTGVCGADFSEVPRFNLLLEGLTCLALQKGKIVLLDDENRFRHIPYSSGNTINSEMVIPLGTEQVPIGVIVLSSASKGVFSNEDESIAETIGHEISSLIASKRLTKSLLKISTSQAALPAKESREKILNDLASELRSVLSVPVVCIWKRYYEEGQDYLKLEHSTGHAKGSIESDVIWPDEKSISNNIVKTTEVLLAEMKFLGSIKSSYFGRTFNNLRVNPLYRHKRFVHMNNLETCISFPIVLGKSVEGVANIYSRQPVEFSNDETLLVRLIIDKYTFKLVNWQSKQQIIDLNAKILSEYGNTLQAGYTLETSHDVKHQFNSLKSDFPAIIGFIPSNVRKENSATIKDYIDRQQEISTLFNQLTLARATQPLELEYCNLLDVIDMVDDMFEYRKGKTKIDYSGIPKELLVKGDETRLRQVFGNLMINALQSLEDKLTGPRLINVTANLSKEGMATIYFSDNGPGIKEEDLNSIYDRNYTTKGGKGSGFGLAICQDIVENLFLGSIKAISEPGIETTFIIKIKGKLDDAN